MNLQDLPINLFDVAFVIMLVLGVMQGRRHGMSAELIDLIKWMVMLATCASLYELVSEKVTGLNLFGRLGCHVVAYLTVGTVVYLVFTFVKNRWGGKLVGSDMFGKAEYYLGMGSGLLRTICVILVGLALLNARYYSEKEVRANEAYQLDMYGSDFFPGLYSVQNAVFQKSLIGPVIHQTFSPLFIQPTPYVAPEQFKQRELTLP